MMRFATLSAILALSSIISVPGATIAQWDFNGVPPDAEVSTGSLSPSQGEGTLTLIGGVQSTFGSVGGGQTTDPALSDNTQLRLTRLPSISEANQCCGIELTLATIGFENISLQWDQYNSATGSRYWRVQYTIDGFAWIDHQVVVNTNASTWTRFEVPFHGVTEANNRPYLSLRITPEFESTASGAGADSYAAVKNGSTYTAAGSWWVDMITISGRVPGTTNIPPVMSDIGDITMVDRSASEPIEFIISDPESSAQVLSVTALSSDSKVITNIDLAGAGTNRSITLHAGTAGSATITVRVTDEEGAFTEQNFKVSVLPEGNEEPMPNRYLALWNFNSPDADADPTTGSFEPSLGAGNLTVIGTGNFVFGSVGQSRTSDPAESDNSMLRLGLFPSQGTGSKTAGIEIRLNTAGLRNIGVAWDQYNSATASRFWRLQFSTNGVEFTDHDSLTNSTASTWTRNRSASFQDIAGVENNPDFAVRLVSEFGPEEVFVAVSDASSYSTAGTLWLDMVGITGESVSTESPALTVTLSESLNIAWPISSGGGFQLEARENWSLDWNPVETAPVQTGGYFHITIPAEGGARFFRLRQASAP